MHRTFTLTVPPAATDSLCRQLEELPEVIGLSVQAGGSRKPPGDIVTLQVLNRGADEVLRRVRAAIPREADLSIATAELASMIAPAQHQQVRNDRDEAIWEEISADMHYQSRLSYNYLILMILGGILAAVGLVMEPVSQTITVIASSIISPGFEPIARIPLNLILRRWPEAGKGLFDALVGYAVFVLAAFLTMRGLLAIGASSVAELVTNPMVASLRYPGWKELLVAAIGAVAGILMLAAFRRHVMAGPLVAMVLMEAAALIGCGLAAGRTTLAWSGVERFLADAGFVLLAGLLIFGLKQWLQHQRKPLV